MKKMIPVLFSAMMLFACSVDEKPSKEVDSVGGDTKVEKEEVVQKYNIKDAKKLTFNKEIQLIKITEENTGTVDNRPISGIASQDSYITEKRGLHLLYNAKLPTEDTEFIVIKEINDNGYLLDYDMYYFDNEEFEVVLNEVNNEVVNNSKRSFLNTKLSFSMDSNNKLSIKKDGVNFFELGDLNDSKHELLARDEKDNSKLTIEHYGKINSISDISYDEIKDDKDLLTEYKRESKVDDKNETKVD